MKQPIISYIIFISIVFHISCCTTPHLENIIRKEDKFMNYEDLYQALLPQEKSIKDSLASLQKLNKTISKETESGDLKNLIKDLNIMLESTSALSDILNEAIDTVSSFDTVSYFESGDFAEQMLSICREKNVDVRGDSPIYEMFPYRVKLDMDNQDIYLDRKKIQCMRPQSFVDLVKSGQDKLNKAAFNAQTFAGELADAYDMAVMKNKKQPGSDLYLNNLYKILAPMSRFRKDYDQQSFAFDLSRLYSSGIEETKNGRKFQFGPSRLNNKAIRILDQNGQEVFLATIRFFE